MRGNPLFFLWVARIASEDGTKMLDDGLSLPRQFIEETIQPILKEWCSRDELLGRINEILYFLPFSEVELKQLTTRELNKWASISLKRHNIKLKWEDSAIDLLRDGYNIRYGARSIQHEVEKRVINQLAKYHESGNITNGSTVKVKGDLERNVIEIDLIEKGEENEKKKGWFSGGGGKGDGHGKKEITDGTKDGKEGRREGWVVLVTHLGEYDSE